MSRRGEGSEAAGRREDDGRVDAPPTPVVSFGGDAIAFASYPYPGASVYPSGALRAADVEELVANFRPPVVRTRSGEFLVVPSEALAEARAFAERHGIPVVRRVDVWALILAPFMDAPVDGEARRRMREALACSGLSPWRVFLLRWRTSFRVEFVHCVHFRWQHYGLADVLDSMGALRTPGLVARFHRTATQITALGRALAEGEPDPAEPLRAPPKVVDVALGPEARTRR